MGWFADKYGEDTHPKMSIDTYDKLLDKFGEEAANETLADVQDGKIKEETLLKYLDWWLRRSEFLKKTEIEEFIEEMESIGDKWDKEDVERVYGDLSLEEALADRKSALNSFFDSIGKILNSW